MKMINFNIRCIRHIITKIRDEGFGILDVFCQFCTCVSPNFCFSVSVVLCLLYIFPFCICMSPFDEKKGLKAVGWKFDTIGFWALLLHLLCLPHFKAHIAIYTPIYTFLHPLHAWVLDCRTFSLCPGLALSHTTKRRNNSKDLVYW